ncbi:MAG: hypothetical protein FJ276_32025 [Planctomycetes bacterium]|nr:hypothetical protein [Planctomycetota bacterium]
MIHNKPATNRMSWDDVCRRAGGRRHYNRVRHALVLVRLARVVELLVEVGTGRGCQTRIAERLGTTRATVCRDFARLRAILGGTTEDHPDQTRAGVKKPTRGWDDGEAARTVASSTSKQPTPRGPAPARRMPTSVRAEPPSRVADYPRHPGPPTQVATWSQRSATPSRVSASQRLRPR